MNRFASSFSLPLDHVTRFERVGADIRHPAPGNPAATRAADADLLGRALDGGPAAIRELVNRLQPTVQAEVALVVLRRSSGGPAAVRVEVEDLIQDVWETLFRDNWRVLRQYQPERASLRTFVGLISQRVAIDTLRSGRRNPWREQPSAPQQLEDHGLLPVSFEQRVQDRNLLENVYACLESELGNKGKSALESMFARGLSVEEAARDTGMTKSALYSWKKRITQRARAIVSGWSSRKEDT